MKITFDINKTEDGYTMEMKCTETPENPMETIQLKRIVANSLNDEIEYYDEKLKEAQVCVKGFH